MKFLPSLQHGQSLIEILLAIGLASLLLPALATAFFATRSGRAQEVQRLEAVTLLKEAQEAVRQAREASWNNMADGTYHPTITGAAYSLASGSETINGYTRQIVITTAYRNASGGIAPSGSADPSTKKVVLTVSWGTPFASSVSSTTYITRYLSNLVFTDTTQSDFNAGANNGTTVAATTGSSLPGDGQIKLAEGGFGDWCSPQQNILRVMTLPKIGNTLVATQGAAYIGTGDGTNGVTFINAAITNPAHPATPSASILGTYASSYQTNDIWSDGQYAFLATSNTSDQVIILDIRTAPYTQVGTIDIPGSDDPTMGIYVDKNIAYVTNNKYLYTFNVATKNGSHTSPLTSIALWKGQGKQALARLVRVVGNHAYVGAQDSVYGLQVFKISDNGATLQLVGVSNFAWSHTTEGLFINPSGTRAYVSFSKSNGNTPRGFFIVDTSPPDPPTWWTSPNYYDVIGQYDSAGLDPRGISVATGTRAILVGLGGTQQYQVIDLTDETNPIQCGGLSIPDGVTDVSTVLESDGDAYAYLISGEASNQFKIIQGGLGGIFLGSGNFVSRAFDATNSAAFNRLTTTIAQGTLTSIKFQVAAANPPFGSNCSGASYTFLGPGGDSNAYFTTTSTVSASFTIPFGSYTGFNNPARCFKYKAYMTTTDYTQTPLLKDATLNYSP